MTLPFWSIKNIYSCWSQIYWRENDFCLHSETVSPSRFPVISCSGQGCLRAWQPLMSLVSSWCSHPMIMRCQVQTKMEILTILLGCWDKWLVLSIFLLIETLTLLKIQKPRLETMTSNLKA